MQKPVSIAILVILGLCCFAAQAQEFHDLQHYYSVFKDWSQKSNKQYGIEEMAVRYTNWKANFDLVQEHNSKDLTWKLEMNDFGDMTSEEFSALHLGFNFDAANKQKKNNNNNEPVNNQTKSNNSTNKKNTTTSLPKSVDWRKEGAVSGVKNQGQCGGCWSFSVSGALEGLHAINQGKLASLSEQQMIDCSASYGNLGCNGGLMSSGFEYTRDHGIQTESDYAYTAKDGKCKYDSKKVVFKNHGYQNVTQNDSLALKQAVSKQPVSIGIEASGKALQLFKSGVITSGCGTDLDHGVLIVGYDTTKDGQEYWIVKNSWGTNWGQNGYMNIAMGSQNKGAGVCGINMAASYPTM